MKNKVLIGSLIATLFSFMLYSASLKRVQNSTIRVIGPKTSSTLKTNKKQLPKVKEPKVNSVEYTNHVKVDKGSQQDLTKQIKQVMGTSASYQVSVQNLNKSSKYARVTNSSKVHGVDDTMKLFLLAAIYHQEQKGKLTSKTAIKVKKSDRVKGEKMLKTGMAYGIAYLKRAMMRGDKTAANALLRRVKPSKVNSVAQKLGATDTAISQNFTSPAGKTSADDLAKAMTGIYQGKGLNRQYAAMVLNSLRLVKTKPKLVQSISGGIYAIGDNNSAAAIIQGKGYSYCMTVWSNRNDKFAKLGKTIDSWQKKHH